VRTNIGSHLKEILFNVFFCRLEGYVTDVSVTTPALDHEDLVAAVAAKRIIIFKTSCCLCNKTGSCLRVDVAVEDVLNGCTCSKTANRAAS
jgi:hypothetical protein